MSYEEVNLLIAFSAGLLSFFSPCVLPLIPAYLCFITGISINELQEGKDRLRNIKIIILQTILFIIGFSLIFILLGAGATYLGKLLQANRIILRIIGGIIVIIFGLHLMGVFNIKSLQYEKRFHMKSFTSVNIFSAFLLGVVFAFAWTPCIGPILSSILIYASMQDTLNKGIILLSAYSAGLGIPFLFTAVAINTFLNFLQKIKKYFNIITICCGALLIFVGILIITNYFRFWFK